MNASLAMFAMVRKSRHRGAILSRTQETCTPRGVCVYQKPRELCFIVEPVSINSGREAVLNGLAGGNQRKQAVSIWSKVAIYDRVGYTGGNLSSHRDHTSDLTIGAISYYLT